jgi:hypothetical protein
LWYEQSNEAPPRQPGSEPQEFHIGDTHNLTTVGISDAELDAMYNGYGEAISKEKALAFVKGFIAGIMV